MIRSHDFKQSSQSLKELSKLQTNTEPQASGAPNYMSHYPEREPVISVQWIEFVKFCNRLGFGRIEKLEVQNGVPVSAETVTEKVRFG